MKILFVIACVGGVLLLRHLLIGSLDRRRRRDHARFMVRLHAAFLADRLKSLAPAAALRFQYIYREQRRFTYAMCTEPDDSSAFIICRWNRVVGPPRWEFILEIRNPDDRYEASFALLDGHLAACVEKIMADAKAAVAPPPLPAGD